MAMQIEVTNKRNAHGVKNFCDQYRIINGEHFVCEISGQTNAAEKAAEFKAAGAKVRRIGFDVYVRKDDLDKILHLCA